MVADSALYTEETIREISPLVSWITRVPETIQGVQKLYTQVEESSMQPLEKG